MSLIIRPDIGQVEPDREIIVHLHGAKLPLAPDHVFDHEIDLRAVERRLAGLFREGHVEGLGGFATGVFGLVPVGGVAGVFVRIRIPQSDAHAVILHAEGGEHNLHQRKAPEHFGGDLLFGAEQMGVVLRESADAGHAVELAGLLPAINRSELREPHGQIAIGMRLRGEDLDVMRTIHRLQHEAVEQLFVGQHAIGGDRFTTGAAVNLIAEVRGNRFESREDIAAGTILGQHAGKRVVLEHGRELGLFIVREMPRGFIQLKLANVRREHLRVALLAQLFADERLQLLPDHGTVGRPEDEALADVFVDMEKLQFASELTMIAELGLLDLRQVIGEFVL